jgi:hypothetical protein
VLEDRQREACERTLSGQSAVENCGRPVKDVARTIGPDRAESLVELVQANDLIFQLATFGTRGS